METGRRARVLLISIFALGALTNVAPVGALASSANGNGSGSAGSHSSTATNGSASSPQPYSTADSNNTGANTTSANNPYKSSRQGLPSGNGSGNGAATGKPCAGCVGKADNKYPSGQAPNGTDHNAGYECDRNQGIGQTNPAHTGCTAATNGATNGTPGETSSTPASSNNTLSNNNTACSDTNAGNCTAVPNATLLLAGSPQSQVGPTGPESAIPALLSMLSRQTESAGRVAAASLSTRHSSAPTPAASGTAGAPGRGALAFTGTDWPEVTALSALLILTGLGITELSRRSRRGQHFRSRHGRA